jgi:hypothetical protein
MGVPDDPLAKIFTRAETVVAPLHGAPGALLA